MAVGVLLVDDHPVVRTGLRAVIGSRPGVEILGEAATGEEAVVLAGHLRPDVVLCDLRLGDGMDGVATTSALRALCPAPAVIILTTFDRDVDILRAIEAGAAGYLLKDVSPDTIVDAISAAARGDMVLAPELATRVMRGMRNPAPRLTQRELEVLHHLATGSSNREIARALFVSEATIKSHLVHIFTKLDVDSRARAIHVARETGILRPGH
ncbi:response regulator [Tessaracoccus antarcticus]|uniref:DNA-binding response regulator n=1 Tax=Tessaracoccus antarcticus TaxID=2479848 RepID=A0A3M0G7S2_9ACTN|nr:response regulator transcription factor [Tessaracoccus antarcticus]RMB60177.1 DNA-binding response regulator [Tessaracoccus antarcticus]